MTTTGEEAIQWLERKREREKRREEREREREREGGRSDIWEKTEKRGGDVWWYCDYGIIALRTMESAICHV